MDFRSWDMGLANVLRFGIRTLTDGFSWHHTHIRRSARAAWNERAKGPRGGKPGSVVDTWWQTANAHPFGANNQEEEKPTARMDGPIMPPLGVIR